MSRNVQKRQEMSKNSVSGHFLTFAFQGPGMSRNGMSSKIIGHSLINGNKRQIILFDAFFGHFWTLFVKTFNYELNKTIRTYMYERKKGLYRESIS